MSKTLFSKTLFSKTLFSKTLFSKNNFSKMKYLSEKREFIQRNETFLRKIPGWLASEARCELAISLHRAIYGQAREYYILHVDVRQIPATCWFGAVERIIKKRKWKKKKREGKEGRKERKRKGKRKGKKEGENKEGLMRSPCSKLFLPCFLPLDADSNLPKE